MIQIAKNSHKGISRFCREQLNQCHMTSEGTVYRIMLFKMCSLFKWHRKEKA